MMRPAVSIAFTTALLAAGCATRLPSVSLATPAQNQAVFEQINLAGDANFQQWMKQTQNLNIQLVLTTVAQDKAGRPLLTTYTYHDEDSAYFYPASTVKLPVVLLAYEKLNRLKSAGISDTTAMVFEANGPTQPPYYNNADAPGGKSNIRMDAAQILLVSDNEAYNRLYDFVTPAEIDASLKAKGLNHTVIRHRLSFVQPEKWQRSTPVVLFTDTAGHVLHRQDSAYTDIRYPMREVRLGKGFMRGKIQVNQPFDFSGKNRMSITDLHGILLRLAYPEAFPENQRFQLTDVQRSYILEMMSLPPRKGPVTHYQNSNYWDTYCRYLYYGAERQPRDTNVLIRNKVGDAYGFLTDVAWFTDRRTGRSLVLTATISCNSDGIYNDNRYDYKTVGFPFMKQLGRIVYSQVMDGKIR